MQLLIIKISRACKLLCVTTIPYLVSCSTEPRYRIPTMLGGGDFVDATHLVVDKGYKPIYADGQLCAIISPVCPPLKDLYNSILQAELSKWAKQNNVIYNKNNCTDIIYHCKYVYSYFIIDDIVDVYEYNVSHKKGTIKLFFRVTNGELLMPYSSEGWVILSNSHDAAFTPSRSLRLNE